MEEAVTAQEDGDYATAVAKVNSCLMLMASLPDVRHSNGDELRWDRNSLSKFLEQLLAQQAGAAGIQRTKIEYRNPDSSEDE